MKLRFAFMLMGSMFLFSSHSLIAQNGSTLGLLPRVNLAASISPDIKWVSGLESRQLYYDRAEDPRFNYSYVLTDWSNFISFRRTSGLSTNLGYTLRIRDGRTIHRLTQQLNISQNRDGYRLSHRFALDQTFDKNRPSVYRARYRISFERALVGEEINLKEIYLKLAHEWLYLYSSDDDHDLEWRFIPRLGLELGKRSKLEWGVDYRIQSPFSDIVDHDLYLTLTWYTHLRLYRH